METMEDWSIERVIKKAVGTIRADVLRFVLERSTVNDGILTSILGEATNANRCEIVEIVLERCQPMDKHFSHSIWSNGERSPTDVAIAFAMSAAADKGQLDMLQVLLAKGGWFVFQTLRGEGRWGVVRCLLRACDKQNLDDPGLERYAATVLEKAAADDDVEMAELLFTKCGVPMETYSALYAAVQSNSTRILLLLAANSEPSRVVDAFVVAAGRNKVEVEKLLLTHIDQEAIEEAQEQAAAAGNVATSKMLLTRCSPVAYKRIFHKAAASGSATGSIVKLLVDQMDCCSINRALVSAADNVMERLNGYDLAYLHVIEGRGRHANGVDVPAERVSRYFRKSYHGVLISAAGFDRSDAMHFVEDGGTDLVAFGRYFISNPDFVDRLMVGAELTMFDSTTSYEQPDMPASAGYTDYLFMGEKDQGIRSAEYASMI